MRFKTKLGCLAVAVMLTTSCVGSEEVESNLVEATTVKGIYPGVPRPFSYPESGTTQETNCGEYNGSPESWIFVTIKTSRRCELSGSYIILENSVISHRLNISGHHIVVRDSEICCASAGALLNIRSDSHHVVATRNEVHSNGEIPSKTDGHGIRLDANTSHIWILENQIHHNSGDGIQFCHSCVGKGNGPAFVYISGNTIHDDEENAIDLKEFRGPVVVTCNEMYGYEYLGFSGHGEAFRVNDEGAQGELWSAHNTYRDNVTDVLPSRSRATSFFLDEKGLVRTGATAVASGDAAIRHYQRFESRYGVSLRDPCW